MNSHLSFLFLALSICAPFHPIQAATQAANNSNYLQGFTMHSETSEQDSVNEMLILRGQVQIVYNQQHISCDEAHISFRSKTVDARGSVLLISPEATIGAQRITLDLENNTGLIFDGYVQSGNVIFEGELIQKYNEKEFIAERAKYTSCINCPETWSFTGNKIRAELGGYAYLKNTLLRVKGFPVFWLPYMIVPLRSGRQTGLLSPELSRSDEGGLAISESLFVVMGRSQDATITLKSYELRGMKSLFNYRYVLDENSSGELDFALIKDRVFASDSRLNRYRGLNDQGQSLNRWFVRYNHYYVLPENYVHRFQVNNASDLQYPKDYPLETQNHGDSSMETRTSLTKNTDTHHWSIDASYYTNLMQSDPLSGNEDSIHRFPELRLAQTDKKIFGSSFLWSYDMTYSSFIRTGFGYDDINVPYSSTATSNNRFIKATSNSGSCDQPDWDKNPACHAQRDGRFDDNKDLIRSGQRWDGQISVEKSIKMGDVVDVLPKITYRETEYFFHQESHAFNARRYLRGEVSLRTTLDRIYQVDDVSFLGTFKHEIQPEVTASYIPWYYHPYHPFFGVAKGDHSEFDEAPFSSQDNISDSEMNSPYALQFDYFDRIMDRKIITFSITNKLIQKRLNSSQQVEYIKFLNWKLSQSYDAYQAEIRGPQPYSDILSLLTISLDHLKIYQKSNYFPYQKVTNLSSRIRLLNKWEDFVELGHTRTYSITPGQEVVPETRTEELALSVKKNYSTFDLLGKMTYDLNPQTQIRNNTDRIKSYGYGLRLKLPGECWYLNVVQYKKTGGPGELQVSFDFSWEGKSTPPLPENILQAYGI